MPAEHLQKDAFEDSKDLFYNDRINNLSASQKDEEFNGALANIIDQSGKVLKIDKELHESTTKKLNEEREKLDKEKDKEKIAHIDLTLSYLNNPDQIEGQDNTIGENVEKEENKSNTKEFLDDDGNGIPDLIQAPEESDGDKQEDLLNADVNGNGGETNPTQEGADIDNTSGKKVNDVTKIGSINAALDIPKRELPTIDIKASTEGTDIETTDTTKKDTIEASKDKLLEKVKQDKEEIKKLEEEKSKLRKGKEFTHETEEATREAIKDLETSEDAKKDIETTNARIAKLTNEADELKEIETQEKEINTKISAIQSVSDGYTEEIKELYKRIDEGEEDVEEREKKNKEFLNSVVAEGRITEEQIDATKELIGGEEFKGLITLIRNLLEVLGIDFFKKESPEKVSTNKSVVKLLDKNNTFIKEEVFTNNEKTFKLDRENDSPKDLADKDYQATYKLKENLSALGYKELDDEGDVKGAINELGERKVKGVSVLGKEWKALDKNDDIPTSVFDSCQSMSSETVGKIRKGNEKDPLGNLIMSNAELDNMDALFDVTDKFNEKRTSLSPEDRKIIKASFEKHLGKDLDENQNFEQNIMNGINQLFAVNVASLTKEKVSNIFSPMLEGMTTLRTGLKRVLLETKDVLELSDDEVNTIRSIDISNLTKTFKERLNNISDEEFAEVKSFILELQNSPMGKQAKEMINDTNSSNDLMFVGGDRKREKKDLHLESNNSTNKKEKIDTQKIGIDRLRTISSCKTIDSLQQTLQSTFKDYKMMKVDGQSMLVRNNEGVVDKISVDDVLHAIQKNPYTSIAKNRRGIDPKESKEGELLIFLSGLDTNKKIERKYRGRLSIKRLVKRYTTDDVDKDTGILIDEWHMKDELLTKANTKLVHKDGLLQHPKLDDISESKFYEIDFDDVTYAVPGKRLKKFIQKDLDEKKQITSQKERDLS